MNQSHIYQQASNTSSAANILEIKISMFNSEITFISKAINLNQWIFSYTYLQQLQTMNRECHYDTMFMEIMLSLQLSNLVMILVFLILNNQHLFIFYINAETIG